MKGQGGDAIRAFYSECHLPFLHFLGTFKDKFNSTLTHINSALDTLEPHASGFIRQDFLEVEIEGGLNDISRMTDILTTEANQIMDLVADIISLPRLDDRDVQEGIRDARRMRDNTVADLHIFDVTQTSELAVIEAAIGNMDMWLSDIEGLMTEGLTDIDFPAVSWNTTQQGTPIGSFYAQHQLDLLLNNPRVKENGVEVALPGYSNNDLWAGLASTVGLNINVWQDKPMNAAASLAMFGDSGYKAANNVKLAAQGFGITRDIRVGPHGDRRVEVKITRKDLIGVKKSTYWHKNAENYPKIFRFVDPMTNMKESFKFVGNKVGYIGIATTVGGDIVHGVNNGESASEIAGNVTGDVAIAGASIAASAWAGASAGVIGGPVGVVAGAVIGLVAGVAVTAILSDVKFMDVDNDGEDDSIGDAIKKGTTGIINKVSSWFN